MVRSMYSGVAGMKTHQTRMDVIGNNIANVNTYGFKSSRVTFRDIYYQSMRGAAGASASKGGVNPSEVGYGSALGSIDVLHTQSALSTTGNPLDFAISGDGYIQVMDGDGNKFYTRAGMLDIDAAGNLTDVNGNFVLGTSGKPVGVAPGSNKIQFNIPSVDPAVSSKEEEIRGKKYTVTTSVETHEGNVGFGMTAGTLPDGMRAKAVVEANGTVNVTLNKTETFASLADVTTAVNAAILEANGGKPHPAGEFTITEEGGATWPSPGLTGAEIASSNYDATPGKIPLAKDMTDAGFAIDSVGSTFGSAFTGAPPLNMAFSFSDTFTPPSTHATVITAVIDGQTYTSPALSVEQMAKPGSVVLTNSAAGSSSTDSFIMKRPGIDGLLNAFGDPKPDPDAVYTFKTGADGPDDAVDVTKSAPSKSIGLNQTFKLEKGTKGGPQTVKDLSGISIGADGVISAKHGILGDLAIGRIDLVVFENPKGLSEAGNTYFTETPNSGKATAAITGSSSAGAIAQSMLELSNVDLSQEFSDMITTQRGYQANSRMITVSDTMLEELINLKR